MNRFLFFCAIALPLCLAGKTPRKVIIDVDVGTDDFQALVALLNAEAREEIKIVAIICTDGNAKLKFVVKNVIRLLKGIGRLKMPLYEGYYSSIIPRKRGKNYYGLDGFGNLKLKEDLTYVMQAEFGPNAIARLVNENPKQISYVALGPLTNLALALRMDNLTHKNLKEIFIMGGNFNKDKAEFNFLCDPEAAHIVLDTAKCPMTLLPFQACEEETLTNAWFFNLTIPSNPIWDLNYKAENAILRSYSLSEMYVRCDPILAEAFIDPNLIIKKGSYYGKVELCGERRGQLIVDSNCADKNIVMIEKINVENFKSKYVQNFLSICKLHTCIKNYY